MKKNTSLLLLAIGALLAFGLWGKPIGDIAIALPLALAFGVWVYYRGKKKKEREGGQSLSASKEGGI
jgi:hypothetical protein